MVEANCYSWFSRCIVVSTRSNGGGSATFASSKKEEAVVALLLNEGFFSIIDNGAATVVRDKPLNWLPLLARGCVKAYKRDGV